MGLQTQKKASAEVLSPASMEPAAKKDSKASLRGMSYDEGVKALSPNGTMTGAPVQQKEGGDKKDAPAPEASTKPDASKVVEQLETKGEKTPGEPDPAVAEILENLQKKIKHVELIVDLETFTALSPNERNMLVVYVLNKDKAVKKDKKLKSCVIRVTSSGLEEQTDAQVANAKKEATQNQSSMLAGGDPSGVLALAEGKRTVPLSSIPAEKPEKISVMAESTFPSAEYEATKMNSAAFEKTLAEVAEQVRSLQNKYGPKTGINVTVHSGESLVTPPKGMGELDLAKFRAATAQQVAKAYFAGSGVDIENVVFTEPELHLGTTPYVRGGPLKANDPAYTKEQFLRLDIEMNGQPPPTIQEGEAETDLDIVAIDVQEEREADKAHPKKVHFRDQPTADKAKSTKAAPEKERTKVTKAGCVTDSENGINKEKNHMENASSTKEMGNGTPSSASKDNLDQFAKRKYDTGVTMSLGQKLKAGSVAKANKKANKKQEKYRKANPRTVGAKF